ncbi:MAG: hypothetical protein C0448_11990 [Sphingobacteriaceae bacterium]|nr:hypothetical protein [Sphingobacteriaceae bacterium]
MYKIKGSKPTSNDSLEEIADYIEVKAILAGNHTVSTKEIIKEFLKSADEHETNGVNDLEDIINEKIEPITDEINRRIVGTNNKYPFELLYNGTVIKFTGFNDSYSYLYSYLLYATRLNMRDNKVFQAIDGTQLFEYLSALAAQTYFGDKSKNIVFGTSVAGGFEEKVNQLCQDIGEGGNFVNHHNDQVDEQDGKLDIVSWTDFSDKKTAKLLGFGQCKTGTSWETARFELQPSTFCKKWFRIQPIHDPIRMYFISDIAPMAKWNIRAYDSGILFDRLRIMDCLPENIEANLYNKIKLWTDSAIAFAKA